MLGVLFIAAASAQASPVRYDDVVALASVAGQSGRPSVDLRMRQSSAATQQTASNKGAASQDQKQPATPDATSAPATSPATSLTGTEIAPQQPQAGNVETVDLGEVQGTVCDCGPLPPLGHFPKWPWLALGGIPFLFIDHGCQTQPCEETPPPPPSPPQLPEPATIFLLGTGLAAVGARARRAYSRRNVNADEATGEV